MSNLRKKININGSGNEIFTPTYPGYMIIDGAQSDSFSRIRVSEPSGLLDTQNQYNTSPLTWNESITGGGTVTHLPNESSIRLRLTTASGDKIIRQSKRYLRYQPGKSQFVLLTSVIGAKKANVRQRLGYFDAQNGLFFEQDENNLKVVRRTYVSGSAVDNAVNQSSWNLDKLDGTGTSGYTLDMTKTHIFIIDMQWLGVGRVRFGFDIDGKIIYCHELYNANNLTNVYMTTANLPVRYEIENTGTAASQTDMIQICSSVSSEGGFSEERGIPYSCSNGVTTINVTTRVPILTVRPKTTFNSITNRGEVLPLEWSIYSDASVYYEVILNGTLTGGSFNSVGTYSLTEFDVAASAITGGERIYTGYVTGSNANRGTITNQAISKLALSNDVAGTTTDKLTIVATSFSGTAKVSAAIIVKESY